jgi:hypothetical protein
MEWRAMGKEMGSLEYEDLYKQAMHGGVISIGRCIVCHDIVQCAPDPSQKVPRHSEWS